MTTSPYIVLGFEYLIVFILAVGAISLLLIRKIDSISANGATDLDSTENSSEFDNDIQRPCLVIMYGSKDWINLYGTNEHLVPQYESAKLAKMKRTTVRLFGDEDDEYIIDASNPQINFRLLLGPDEDAD
jgi:hypothetical protein